MNHWHLFRIIMILMHSLPPPQSTDRCSLISEHNTCLFKSMQLQQGERVWPTLTHPPPSQTFRASFYGCWSQLGIMSKFGQAISYALEWFMWLKNLGVSGNSSVGMCLLCKREDLSSSPGTHMKKPTMVTTHACCNPNTGRTEMGALLVLAHWPTSLVQLSNPRPMRTLSQKPKQTEFKEQCPRLMISWFHMYWSYTFEVQRVENQK